MERDGAARAILCNAFTSDPNKKGGVMIDFRKAVKEDSTDIARLFLVSSDGLAEYIWSKIRVTFEQVF